MSGLPAVDPKFRERAVDDLSPAEFLAASEEAVTCRTPDPLEQQPDHHLADELASHM